MARLLLCAGQSLQLKRLARNVRAFASKPCIRHIADVDGVPRAGAFSRSVVAGGHVYVSGVGGGAGDTGGPAATAFSVQDETDDALRNVERVLLEAGSNVDHLVNVTMLLTDRQYYEDANRAYVAFFHQRGLSDRLPARATALWGVPTELRVAFCAVALQAEE